MRIPRGVSALCTCFLMGASALAQGGPPLLEFSFSNPGARSMGFGGAFIGLADDATAAFANPAGLVQLVRPEASLEGRYWGYDTRFTEGGRAFGRPTGIGLDNTEGLRFAVSSNDLADVSYLSFVYPVRNWSFAVYRHKAANFEAVTATQGLYRSPPDNPGQTNRNLDRRVATDLDFVTYGFAFGYRVSDRLSLGFGLSLLHGNLRLTAETFAFNDDSPQSLFAANDYRPDRLINSALLSVDSVDAAVTAGFQWQVTDRVKVGGVYRDGPEFDGRVTGVAGPLFNPSVAAGTVIGVGATPAKFPDVYGLGLSVRSPRETLTLNFDWVRVEYSRITDHLNPAIFDPIPLLDDGNEFRAGIEYVFLKARPLVALRVGGWLDPDHRLRGPQDAEIFERAFFQRGKTELHIAGGVGLVFRRFQLDFGLDLSALNDVASFSAILKF